MVLVAGMVVLSVEIKGSNLEGGHCTFYLEGGALLASRSPSRECTIEDSVRLSGLCL